MTAVAYALQGTVRIDEERNVLPWDLTALALVRIDLSVIIRGHGIRLCIPKFKL